MRLRLNLNCCKPLSPITPWLSLGNERINLRTSYNISQKPHTPFRALYRVLHSLIPAKNQEDGGLVMGFRAGSCRLRVLVPTLNWVEG